MVEIADDVAGLPRRFVGRVEIEAVGALVAPQPVAAGAADQHVVAAAAEQLVETLIALEHIAGCVAGKPVAVFRAAQIFEIAERVALRVAADRLAGAEIDDHAGVGPEIAQPVDAFAPVEQVAAGAAADGVVAEPAVDGVIGAVSGKHIVPAADPMISSTDHQVSPSAKPPMPFPASRSTLTAADEWL